MHTFKLEATFTLSGNVVSLDGTKHVPMDADELDTLRQEMADDLEDWVNATVLNKWGYGSPVQNPQVEVSVTTNADELR